MKKSPTSKPKTDAKFTAQLDLGGTVYVGTGDTPVEALRTMNMPVKVTTKAVLTLTHKKLQSKRFLYPVALRRLLVNKFAQEVFMHNLYKLLR